jgi:exosortase K
MTLDRSRVLAGAAKALPVAASLAFALVMKRYYARADADSLRWMLAPAAWSVGAIYRAPFSFVPGYGYVSGGLRFGIVPACAGVNFLIIAVGSLWCGVVPLVSGAARRALWLVGGLAAAYALTLVANTARIALAVWLELHPLAVDRAALHRLSGCLVYLGFLFAFYALARALARRHAVA